MYAEDDSSPLASAVRRSSSGLHEVAVERSSPSLKAEQPAQQPPPAKPGAGQPSKAFNLTASSAQGHAAQQGLAAPSPPSHAAATPLQQQAHEGGAGLLRQESSLGTDFAPDSRAVMARVNRWWKTFDEHVMQPKFGGPSCSPHASSNNLQAAAAGADPQRSQKSFVVPVSRPGG